MAEAVLEILDLKTAFCSWALADCIRLSQKNVHLCLSGAMAIKGPGLSRSGHQLVAAKTRYNITQCESYFSRSVMKPSTH